ncbi:MAG: electron transfer flavoprotein-ubiquinone oxidoreductase, partial [Pseudomonadota bacterium]
MEQREVMEVDVLFVGGSVGSLSGALHLSNIIRRHNEKVEQDGRGRKLENIEILVLEKAAYPGAHSISGAVMDPAALKELVPDYKEKGAPLEGEVTGEEIYLLTRKGRIKAPFTPPMLNNHGNYVVSLHRLTKWLAGQAEENHVEFFPGFPGTEVLYEEGGVVGIRTGDKGIDRNGEKKPNFSPGIDIRAKITVFGDGSRGNLSQSLIRKFRLDQGKNPQGYVVGIKEVWKVPDGRITPGHVIHTVGYPYPNNTYGGGFIYGMKDNHVSVGLMTGLDYKDPCLDPHREFQKFKIHPFVAGLLKDGEMVQYGAKTAPVGGYFSIPQMYFKGGLLIGDAANLFVSRNLKGIHVAMKSGMLAAETILDTLVKEDFSISTLAQYQKSVFEDKIGKELYQSRNFHQAFQNGLWGGMLKVAFQFLFGGRILKNRLPSEADYVHMKTLAGQYGTGSPTHEQMGDIKYDGERTFNKDADVYYSGTAHEEEQPPHLKIGDTDVCYEKCREAYGNPCIRFCPANVYEMEVDEQTGKPCLKINFTNCLHCKTCEIKDPYENITWVPPEG